MNRILLRNMFKVSLAILASTTGYAGVGNNIVTEVKTDVNSGKRNESNVDAENYNEVLIIGDNNDVQTYNIENFDGREIHLIAESASPVGAEPLTAPVSQDTGVGMMFVSAMDVNPTTGTTLMAVETKVSPSENAVRLLGSNSGAYPSVDQRVLLSETVPNDIDRTQTARVGISNGAAGMYAFTVSQENKLSIYRMRLGTLSADGTTKLLGGDTPLTIPNAIKSNVENVRIAKNTQGKVVIAVQTTSGLYVADLDGKTVKTPTLLGTSVTLVGFAPYSETGFAIAYSDASGVYVRRRSTFSGSFGSAVTLASSTNSISAKMAVAKDNRVYVAFTQTNLLNLIVDVFGTNAANQIALTDADVIKSIAANDNGDVMLAVDTADYARIASYNAASGSLVDKGNIGLANKTPSNLKVVGEAQGAPYTAVGASISQGGFFELSTTRFMQNSQIYVTDVIYDSLGNPSNANNPFVRGLPGKLYAEAKKGAFLNQAVSKKYSVFAESDVFADGTGNYKSVVYFQRQVNE